MSTVTLGTGNLHNPVCALCLCQVGAVLLLSKESQGKAFQSPTG